MNAMNIFNSLPHVDSCCYCISLKLGSITIVLLQLITAVQAIIGSGASKDFNQCYSSGVLIKILGYVAIVLTILLLIAAIYFLIGIFKGDPDSAIWFMYASSLMLVFDIVVSVILMLEKTKKNCLPPYLLGSATLFSALLSFYFLIVIASFHRVMMYR